MRLFIAREAVDTHMKVAGALIDPATPLSKLGGPLVKAAAFYSTWYPKLWLGWSGWPRYGEFGKLATHVRFVSRTSRRLARTLFHCMIRFGPKLEKRQAVLGRLVEIGAELLAITAACARAQAMAKRSGGSGAEGESAAELADVFSRHARRRVEDRFAAVFDNDDVATYGLAQQVLRGEHDWLEEGIVGR